MIEIKLIEHLTAQDSKDDVLGFSLFYEIVGGRLDGGNVRTDIIFNQPIGVAEYNRTRDAIVVDAIQMIKGQLDKLESQL